MTPLYNMPAIPPLAVSKSNTFVPAAKTVAQINADLLAALKEAYPTLVIAAEGYRQDPEHCRTPNANRAAEIAERAIKAAEFRGMR